MSSDTERQAFEERLASVSTIDETLDLDATATISPGQTWPADEMPTLPRWAVSPQSSSSGSLQVIGTLGEGGMGIVHLARQLPLDREVAVKTVREKAGDKQRQVLLQEAWVTGRLEHPNIVPVYTLDADESGEPQIVMKRIEGTPWSEKLGDEPAVASGMRLNRHLEIFLQVCNAVRFAHARGVVHRDIKPQNVMIGHFDEVYLLDWGLAVRLEDDGPTGKEGLAGTPGFMAPEMTHGIVAEIDERTDVYLLGATLHFLLTGKARHQGTPVFEVLYEAWRSEPHEYGPEVPSELGEIANRACAADPDDRFQSVEAFREALDDYRLHRESIELTAEAAERSEALFELLDRPERSDEEELAVHDLFGECRFGFRQALRMWPENEEAREGLQRALEEMANYHVEQENVVGAQACINQLPEPRPQLEGRLEDLSQRLAERAEHLERLERMERSYDLETGMLSRSRLAGILGVVWTLTTLSTAWREATQVISHQEILENHFHAGVRNLVIVVAITAFFRKQLFVNRANRQLMYALLVMVFTLAILRFGAWWADAAVVVARSADDALFGFAAMTAGLWTDRRIALLSTAFYVTLVCGIFWPQTQVWLGAVANFVFFMGLAWIWRKPELDAE